MSGELAYVEFGVEDVEKGRVFYSGLFGWKFEPGPLVRGLSSHCQMWARECMATTGEAAVLFFRVDDIEAAVEKIQELGGSVDDVDVEGMRNRSPDSVGSVQGRPGVTVRHPPATIAHADHMLRRYWPPTS